MIIPIALPALRKVFDLKVEIINQKCLYGFMFYTFYHKRFCNYYLKRTKANNFFRKQSRKCDGEIYIL